MALGLLAALHLACGGQVGTTPGGDGQHDSTGDAGTTTTTGGPQQIIGTLYADTASEVPSDRFDVQLQPAPPATAYCAGATATAGGCCYFAPTPPPPDPVPGSGGSVATEANAGPITLVDATSNASLGTFGFSGWGYMSLPMSAPDVWHAGDLLSVSAAGAQIGAFRVSALALIPPAVQAPSSFAATEDMVITWQPDPNADTMSVTIDDDVGGIVACSAPDAQGTVTMPGSLLAAFRSGDRCEGSAERATTSYAQTPTGRVAFVTSGWTTFDASVQ